MAYQIAREMIDVVAPDQLLQLFRRLSEGDVEALAQIYDEISSKIYGLALWRTGSNEDAADVVQEVFVKLATRSRQLGSVRRPLSYVLRMAHHECINLHRQRRLEEPLSADDLLIANSNRDAIYAARLSELIRELPAKQREAIYLRHFLGLSLREISAASGATLFTVASRCRLGIHKLKTRLGEQK